MNKISNRKFFKTVLIGIFALILLSAAGVLLFIGNTLKNVSEVSPTIMAQYLADYKDTGNSETALNEKEVNRVVISIDEMSPALLNAFISTEDKTFWNHNGFSSEKLLDTVVDILSPSVKLGSKSTITQQLARNLFLTEVRTSNALNRKIQEAYYTIELEKNLSKDQILEAYLNQIYLGAGTSGVEAASEKYFSKKADELTVVEAALLAGIPKSPATYSPILIKKREDVTINDYVMDDSDIRYVSVFNPHCIDRYLVIIELMKQNGYITSSEYQAARSADIKALLVH